jgi:parallel beta-helix repeat protein
MKYVMEEGFWGMSFSILQVSLIATFGVAFARADVVRATPVFRVAGPTLSSDRLIRVRKECMVTVGQTEGDLQGKDDKIIQAAVDYVTRSGGGTVRILPGVYELHNAIHLRPRITLQGSGSTTILKKAPSFGTHLAQDADFCEWGVGVQDANGFRPNDGVMVRAQIGDLDWQYTVVMATIMRIEGNVLFLDRTLQDNFGQYGDTSVATIFPLLTAEKTDDVTVQDLVLDGNREHNEYVHGNFCGAVYLNDCDRWRFSNVIAANFNGDGFSYQSCDDLQIEDCTALNNAGYGFHPGSGAQRNVLRRCIATANGLGLYICWGVSDASIEDCTLSDNKEYGISIGYRDTDNTVQNCTIERNGKAGILFRDEGLLGRCSSRAHIVDCTIADNGRLHAGIGIEIQGRTRDITIANSRLVNNAGGNQWVGISIGKAAKDITLNDNTFDGLVVQVCDQRPTVPSAPGQ